jgi:hypothetical protein
MALIAGSILVAIFVVPPPWGSVLVGGRNRLGDRGEGLLVSLHQADTDRGRPRSDDRAAVAVISPCRPEGRVQLLGERWKDRSL